MKKYIIIDTEGQRYIDTLKEVCLLVVDRQGNTYGHIVLNNASATSQQALESFMILHKCTTVLTFNGHSDIHNDVMKWLVCDTIEVIDLYSIALELLASKKKYKNFCQANGYITKSGKYYQTSLEVFTRYIKQDVSYKQKHNAYSDCLDTQLLFNEIIRQKKKLNKVEDFLTDKNKYKKLPRV